MTLPARRRGRSLLTVTVAAASLAGSLAALAQQPANPPPGAAAAPAAAKKAPAKGAAAVPDEKSAESYSLGVMWGSQLHGAGLTPETVNAARIAQGIRDALGGKTELSDQDRENIRKLSTSVVDANHRAAEKFLAENGKKSGIVTTRSGLEYQELKAGSGDSPKMGDTVTVNYRGMLLNGTEFDSSYKRGEPASFEVGHVIAGWNEALQLMKPGAKWKLFIPPKLAYDLRSPPSIPPGSMLIFDVELIGVKAAPPAAGAPPAPKPPTGANTVPGAVPPSAMPHPTGKPPVNPADSSNSPPPASLPASK